MYRSDTILYYYPGFYTTHSLTCPLHQIIIQKLASPRNWAIQIFQVIIVTVSWVIFKYKNVNVIPASLEAFPLALHFHLLKFIPSGSDFIYLAFT